MIMDMTEPETYSDETLQDVIVASAQLIGIEMDFTQTFAASVTDVTITPDPTGATEGIARDDSFINLCCMKSACIIERGETRQAAAQGIMIRDAGSAVDTRGQVLARLKMLQQNWCKVFEDAKLEYLSGQVHAAGQAIMGPIRLFATGLGGATPSYGYQERRFFN